MEWPTEYMSSRQLQKPVESYVVSVEQTIVREGGPISMTVNNRDSLCFVLQSDENCK